MGPHNGPITPSLSISSAETQPWATPKVTARTACGTSSTPHRKKPQRPIPPGESKSKDTRYLDIHEDDQLDEARLAAWVKQASQLPGERL
jgi:hypothetical protein